MSLKTDIVIRNEYSIKLPDGSGSRGSTPGQYVTRYMARNNATEPVAPIRYAQVDDFIVRYMAREDAVESFVADATFDMPTPTLSTPADPDDEARAPETPQPVSYDQGSTPPPGVRTVKDEEEEEEVTPKRRGRTSRADRPTLRERRAQRREQRAIKRAQRREARALRRQERAGGGGNTTGGDTAAQPEKPRTHVRSTMLTAEFNKAQGYGGVAFSQDDVSLSHEDLMESSREIQELFNNGHTVLKTVLSFTHDYLVKHQLVPADMGAIKPGDYRGQLDQMKLRMAIMQGLGRMSNSGFDNMKYVGVIQVDTKQVHCHLALVDAGRGQVMPDGTQRGKISSRQRALLRRGTDSFLDRHKHMAHLSSAVGYERRNVVSYVKRWAFETMSVESSAQFVLACLPENKNLWRASSHQESMRKPNQLVRLLVEERIAQSDSPMHQAMADVRNYAYTRWSKEGLSTTAREQLIDQGRERIIEGCINGVYQVLASIPESERVVSTSMMNTMSQDFETLSGLVALRRSENQEKNTAPDAEVAEEGPSFEEFSLRLRSYTARLEHHQRMREEFHLKSKRWEDAHIKGQAMPGSKAIYDFYRVEEQYHAQAVSKYRHFLTLTPATAQWQQEWEQVAEYGQKLVGLKALRADKSIARMGDEAEAERLGHALYNQPGGALLSRTGEEGKAGRAQIDDRIERMEVTYARMVDDVKVSWSALSARIEVVDGTERDTDDGVQRIYLDTPEPVGEAHPGILPDETDVTIYTPGVNVAVALAPEYDFAEVKGVDLHDMHYDWLSDKEVGRQVTARFVDHALTRRLHIERARVWLELTDQHEAIDVELGDSDRDVTRMENTAMSVSETGMLSSQLLARARQRAEQVREQQRLRVVEEERLRREREEAENQAESAQEATDAPEIPMQSLAWRRRTVALDRRIGGQVGRAMDEQMVWRDPDAGVSTPGDR